MDFNREVLSLVRQIPRGKVSTYGEIAKALGDVRAARAVGVALSENPKPVEIPCHRVVHSDGRIGGYKLGVRKKVSLLKGEGVPVKTGGVLNFSKHLFTDFKTTYPLKELRALQKRLSRRVTLEDSFERIETVAGIDVSYQRGIAIGACVIFDYPAGEIIDERLIRTKAQFPYIPTYLSFREYPVIEKLIGKLEHRPTVLMLDGNGVLHPLGVGLAAHAGVMLGLSTIGIAKNLLCGKQTGSQIRDPAHDDRLIGYVLKSSKSKNPVYVSPGNMISFSTALKVTKEFCRHRIPEPTRLAHTLSKSSRH